MAVNSMNDVTLIPAAELAPGAIGAIRRQVTKALLAKASKELQMPESDLVARDIRPYTDIAWATHANFVTAAITTDLWVVQVDGALSGYQEIVVSGSDVMADQRFVAIYGLRDARYTLHAEAIPCISLVKIQVGNSIKAIWDLEKLSCYRTNMVGISPSAVIIPQNSQFQFFGYITDLSIWCYLQLEGIVVEPRGKVLSP